MPKVTELSNAFLTCRTYGHAWAPKRVWRVKERQEYLSQLECARCETKRYQRLDRKGTLLGNTYSYPEDYRKKKGEEKITRLDARAEFLDRTLR